jgi:cytochrome c peroxidase
MFTVKGEPHNGQVDQDSMHPPKGEHIMVTQRFLRMGCLAAGMMLSLGLFSTQLQAQSSLSVGTVTVDGITVTDIGPLPTVVPIPATNLNYTAKVELGKQLYFDGRLSKDNAIACAFCHNPFTGFADPRQTSIGVGGGSRSPGFVIIEKGGSCE